MKDVAIIGLGIIGTSAARALSRYKLSVVGFDRASDFACGASAANSGIVHAGHDAKPGTLKARFNLLGSRIFEHWSSELEVPYQNNESLVLCRCGEDEAILRELFNRGIENGVSGLEIVSGEEARRLEPRLSSEVTSALRCKTGAITCPYEFTFACAENARANGAQFFLNTSVTGVRHIPGGFLVAAGGAEYPFRAILNAAGAGSAWLNNLLCEEKIELSFRRGEYLLMDRGMGETFSRTLFPLPTKLGKGILISPTVDGNLFIGPTSLPVDDPEDTRTSQRSFLIENAKKIWPDMPEDRFITSFCGVRAHPLNDDFIVGEAPGVPFFFNAAGIESPGLTSAPAIAQTLAMQIADKLGAAKRSDFNPYRKAIPRFRKMTEQQRAAAIAQNPQYANLVCRCELVSEAEIVEAIHRGAFTVDGIKRRVRAGMGKCQGGFCLPKVMNLISRETGLPYEQITKRGQGSEILLLPIR